MKSPIACRGFTCALATFCVCGCFARADIVSVAGDVVVAEPPASIGNTRWTSRTHIRAWFERRTTLSSPITVNQVATGEVTAGNQMQSGQIPAGVPIQSYMVRFDPGSNNGLTRMGTVTFNSAIMGVIVTSGFGSTDDILGRPGVTYNTNNNRGLELGNMDSFSISSDRRQLSVTMYVLNLPTDDIRVITEDSEAVAGACCEGTTCSTIAQAGCGASFLGIGTTCGPADNPTTCCPANFNSTSGVSVQDIFDYLTAWFANSSAADFNGAGGVTVQDVFDFLTAWFQGC